MADIQDLRRLYPEFDEYGYSDEEAVAWIAEETGIDPRSMAAHYGLIDPDQGDWMRGTSSGIDAAQGGVQGVIGLAGETLGLDSVRDFGYEGYKRNMDLINLRSKPTDAYENIDSVGDAADFAQYYSGYAVPQIVEAVVGSKGLGYGARKGTEAAVKKRLGDKAEDAMQRKGVQDILDKAQRKGEVVGGFGQGYLQELGVTYGGAADEQGVGNVDLGDVYTYGSMAGALEGATDLLTMGLAKIGPAKDLMDLASKGGRVRRATTKGLAGGTMEGLTEMGQTGLEEMGAGASFEEANFSDPTSFFAGAIGGGQIGALGGLRRSAQADEELRVIAEETAKQTALEAEQLRAEREEIDRQEAIKFAEEEAQARRDSELMDEHRFNGTFPTEKEFIKERTQALMDQLDDPDSELGAAFKEWRIENNRHDRTDADKKEFIKLSVPEDKEAIQAEYLEELRQHAVQKELEKNRNPMSQARIDRVKQNLVTQWQQAKTDNNLEQLNQIEAQAEQELTPAEWREAKRANALPSKKSAAVKQAAKNKVTTDNTVDDKPKKVVAENDDEKELTKTQILLRREAVEKLGEDFAVNFPALQDEFAAEKNAKKNERIRRELKKALADLAKMQKAKEAKEAAKEREQIEDKGQRANALVSYILDNADEANLSEDEKQLFKLLKDSANEGTLNEYAKEEEQGNALDTEAVGAALGKDYATGNTQVIRLMGKLAESAGMTPEEIAAELALTGTRRGEGIKATTKQDEDIEVDNDQNKADVIEVQPDSFEDVDPTEANDSGTLDDFDPGDSVFEKRSNEDGKGGPSFQIINTAGGSGSNTDAKSRDKQFEEKLVAQPDPVYQAKVRGVAKKYIEDRDAAVNDKEVMKAATIAWNRRRSGTRDFSEFTPDQQYSWIRSLEEYDLTQDSDQLTKDAIEMESMSDWGIVADDSLENPDEKRDGQTSTEQGSTTEAEEVVQGRSETTSGNEKTRDAAEQSGRESTEQVPEVTTSENAKDVSEVKVSTKKKRTRKVTPKAKPEAEVDELSQDVKNFKKSYSEKDGATGGLWKNPDLKHLADYADFLGALTDDQWKKIGSAFTKRDNPFLIGAYVGTFDAKKSQAKIVAALGSLGKGTRTKAARFVNTTNAVSQERNAALGNAKSVGEALQIIIDKGNEFEKALAERLKPILEANKTKLVMYRSRKDLDNVGLSKQEADGVADMFETGFAKGANHPLDLGLGSVIALDARLPKLIGLNNLTFLHEALHAATSTALYMVEYDSSGVTMEQKALYQQLESLRDFVVQQLDGMTTKQKEDLFDGDANDKLTLRIHMEAVLDLVRDDLHEFITYGFTDPIMKETLLQVKVGTGSRKKSALTKFVEAIRNFFKVDDSFISAFDDLVSTTDALIDEQADAELAFRSLRKGLSTRRTLTKAARNLDSLKGKNKNKVKENVSKVREWAETNLGPKMGQFIEDSTYILSNAADSAKFLHQFISDVKEGMPAAEAWYRAVLSAEKTRNDIRQKVESIAVQAREMPDERRKVVNDLIGDMTYEQKWGYDPEGSHPKLFKGRGVKVDGGMAARFEQLNKDEQKLIKDIFAHGEEMRQRKIDIAKKLGVDSKFFTGAALEGPYAPLKRFGNIVVQLKSDKLIAAEKRLAKQNNKANQKAVDDLRSDPNHYVFKFFDTKGAAKQYRDANLPKYPNSPMPSQKVEEVRQNLGSNQKVYEKILGALKADSALDSQAKAAFSNMIKDMYFQSLDESSARLSGAKRKNIAGYEEDMIRSFLDHVSAESNLIANMEHGAEINGALITAQQEARADSSGKLVDTYNMIARHYQDMYTQRDTSIQDSLLAANTAYMLTTSVGYHVTNATQPVMVTIPKLAGDFGQYGSTWSALWRGYRLAKNVVTADTKNFQAGLDLDKVPAKYRPLMEELNLRQLLDVGMDQDLAEFKSFDTGYAALNAVSKVSSKWAHRLYQIARLVEIYNRVSSAAAAYDLASANPQKVSRMGLNPTQYATKIVQDTQGNFSRLDAPYILKKLPKITGQYRKYQMMMGWMYANALKQATMGDTKEEQIMGARTVGYALTHAGVFAGAAGMPFIGGIATFFMGFSGDGDEPEDFQRWIRDQFDDPMMADLVSKGLPTVFGLDMSTKLTQNNIFSIVPYADLEASEQGVTDYVYSLAMGPLGGTLKNFGRSAEYASNGNVIRAVEYATPKGIRSLLETYRMVTEGYTLKNGDVVAPPEHFSGLRGSIGLVFNALGIPSTDVNNFKWTRGQQFELSQWASDESSRIRREYVEAYRDRDRSAMKELRQEWKVLQDTKAELQPFFGNDRSAMKRQSMSVLMKAPKNQAKRELKYRKQLGTN